MFSMSWANPSVPLAFHITHTFRQSTCKQKYAPILATKKKKKKDKVKLAI
jgi:hypothetical protein